MNSGMTTEPTPPFRFTRESHIRIDAEGHVFHEGERVLHPRLEQALASWVDVDDATGRYVLRNSLDWCYVAVDDAPLAVRRALPDAAKSTVILELSDGSSEALDVTTLSLAESDVLYCRVRNNRLPARFVRSAAFTLLECVTLEGNDAMLRVGALSMRIPRRDPSSTNKTLIPW